MAPSSRFRAVEGWAHTRTKTGTHVPGASTHHPLLDLAVPGCVVACAQPKHRWRRVPGTPDTLSAMPRIRRVGLLAVALAVTLVACSGGTPPSFDPTGECTTDGRAAGAYPDLEALVPKTYRGATPQTLDSGRNCTVTNLGSLASLGISEVRFAGGTWTFGGERAVVLAVFRTKGLNAESLAAFYAQSAKAATRTQIVGQSAPEIAGRSGLRLDTKTGERVQTVVVWPAVAKDAVNVVISNDLPDARIQDAIDAFGGQ